MIVSPSTSQEAIPAPSPNECICITRPDGLNRISIIKKFEATFQKKESEDNWQDFKDKIDELKECLAYFEKDDLIEIFQSKPVKNGVTAALISERSKLLISALNLIETLSIRLREDFIPLSVAYLSPVLKLSAKAKRIIVFLSRATLIRSLEVSACHVFIPTLRGAISSISKPLRETAAIGIHALCKCCQSSILIDFKSDLEEVIKAACVDQLQPVRESAKSIWNSYVSLFPNTFEEFGFSLSFNAKKNLCIDVRSIKLLPRITKQPSNTSKYSQHVDSGRATPRLVKSSSTISCTSKATGFSLSSTGSSLGSVSTKLSQGSLKSSLTARSSATGKSSSTINSASTTRSITGAFKDLKTGSSRISTKSRPQTPVSRSSVATRIHSTHFRVAKITTSKYRPKVDVGTENV